MDRKKRILMIVPMVFLCTSLTSCFTIASIIEEGKDIITDDKNAVRKVVTELKSTTVPQGACAFSSLRPTSLFETESHGKVTNEDVTDHVSYRVIEKDTKYTYKAGDVLPLGKYYLKTVYINKTYGVYENNVDFEVVPVGEQDSTKKGYYEASLAGKTLRERQTLGALGGGLLPSVGNPYMLVVPIKFKDTKQYWTNDDLELLDECYFGEGLVEEGGWYSLKEYYEKSSYGKLVFDGEITPVLTCSLTEKQFESDAKTGKAHRELVEEIIYRCQTDWNIDLNNTDWDNDGWMDGIELIYKSDRDENDNPDVWWNYTGIVDRSLEPSTDMNNPNPRYFFFSQFSRIDNGWYVSNKGKFPFGKKKHLPDAHTIVHETGHMMGAADYYSYDTDPLTGRHTDGALGGNDMMDFNVGDHNAYTKSLYGWTNPWVIDGSLDQFTITLPSFATTGNYILLRNTSDPEQAWNGTPFDEYLILSYYTPDGVNYPDCNRYKEYYDDKGSVGYGGAYPVPGLQVLHVDSRLVNELDGLGRYDGSYTYYDKYLEYDNEEEVQIKGHTYTLSRSLIGQSNTAVGGLTIPFSNVKTIQDQNNPNQNNKRLLSAISADYERNVYNNPKFTEEFGVKRNLFGTKYGGFSDDFSMYKYKEYFLVNDFKFNDGSELNWDFSIVDQTSHDCTIKFVKTF